MDPVVLFIIVFVVAPIIERLLKGRQQQPPPPQQRPRREPRPLPRPRPEPSREPAPYPEQSDPLPHAEQRGEPASAADMLPDDLWEILTGQRREPPPTPTERVPAPEQRTESLPQPRRPRPGIVRKPLPSAEQDRIGRSAKLPERRPDAGPGELTDDEESRIPQEATREQYQVEGYIREIPVHKAPEVVSLEEVDLDEERRHTRFHQRVAGMAAPAQVQRARAHKLSVLFRQRNELRRAIMLREVLGSPKSLE